MAQVKARTQTMPWWLFLITGIAWLLIAMVVLRFNISSITTVGILLGALFLAAAINEFFVSAVVDTWRWAHILLGILFVFGVALGLLPAEGGVLGARIRAGASCSCSRGR